MEPPEPAAPVGQAPTAPPAAVTGLRRLTRLGSARARFWGVVVPIHVAAFAVLYFGNLRLLDRAWTEAGATAARFRLEQAVRDMPLLIQAARAGRSPHVFAHLLAAHQPIGLRLYRGDGEPLDPGNISTPAAERARVDDFLVRAAAAPEVWIESDAERRHYVRGLVRLAAEGSCANCHQAGSTLGVASMKIDFTAQYDEIRSLLGRRLSLLLGAWLALIAGVALLVQRSVRRSAAQLHADLAAASAGHAQPAAGGELPLDPMAAEVHRGVRTFLARQRARESEVASRLERVDQLASLGQLAAGLAHEIKNPLAGIQGAIELLRDEAPTDENRRLHDEMLGELRRVHGILQRLLESGRPAPLRLVATDVARHLTETADLLAPALRRNGVTLTVEAADALPRIQVDPAKLRQVLVNLIQNASEAMVGRGGRVTLRASRLPEAAGVLLEVEDDGPGIPPAQQVNLFEPFFTTKFTGTGLGLSISKSLVEQHGGRIEVDSEPGRGTTFLVYLPERPPDAGHGPGTES
jgi:signal transduction histidine kinase